MDNPDQVAIKLFEWRKAQTKKLDDEIKCLQEEWQDAKNQAEIKKPRIPTPVPQAVALHTEPPKLSKDISVQKEPIQRPVTVRFSSTREEPEESDEKTELHSFEKSFESLFHHTL